MAAREHVDMELDPEVVAILRRYAAEAHVSESEIVERAVRSYDLRSLLARLRARSDLDEDQAMELVRTELQAARTERDAAA
jgi:Ribbon-helix-helix protein, copG family